MSMFNNQQDDAVEDAGIQFAQALTKVSFAQSGETNFFNFKVAREGLNALQQQNPLTGGMDQLMRNVESASVILDQAFQKMVNQMGMGANLATEIKQEFSEAAIDIIRLGGTENDALNMQLNTLDSMGRNVLLTSERMTEFYSMARATGQELPALQKGFKDIGTSIYQIDNEMIKVIDTANRLGVSSKVVSKAVVENLQQLNRLGFENGIEGLAEMAAKSSALRTNMADVFKFADKVLSPESAIETAAALQRLGVTSSSLVDPLRLMDLAQNNVPELNEELGKMLKTYTYFDEKSQSFRIMPSARKDLKALEDAMDIPLDQLEKFALGAADVDKKMSEISFAGFGFDDETKQLVANLSELGEGGEYKITTKDASGQLVEQSVTELLEAYKDNPAQLKEALMEAQGEEGKTAEERMLSIAEQQLDMLTSINKANEAAMKAPSYSLASGIGQEFLKMNETGAKTISKTIVDALGPGSDFNKDMDKSAVSIREAAEAIAAGDYTTVMTKIQDTFINIGTGFGAAITDVMSDIKGGLEGLDQFQQMMGTIMKLPTVSGAVNQVQNSNVQNLFSQNLNTSNNASIQNLNQPTADLGTGIQNLNNDINNLTTATTNLLVSSESLKTATEGLSNETVAMITNSTVMNDYAQSLTTAAQNFYETSETLVSYVTNMSQNTINTNTFTQGPIVTETSDIINLGDVVTSFDETLLKTNQVFQEMGINNYGTTKGEKTSIFNTESSLLEKIISDNEKNNFLQNKETQLVTNKSEFLTQAEKSIEKLSSKEFMETLSEPLVAEYQPKKEKDLLDRVMETNKSELFSSSNFNTNVNSVATLNGGEPLKVMATIKFEGADKLSDSSLSAFENELRKTSFAQKIGTAIAGVNFNLNSSSPLRGVGVSTNTNTGVQVS